jgi:hypothetical protein
MTQFRSASALRWSLCFPAAILALAPGLGAQTPTTVTELGESPERYAQVKVLEGDVIIHKGEQDETLALGVPVAEGDTLESQGRGILQLGDGSRIAFDGSTKFQVAELFADTKGVREVLLKLEYGRIRIRMGARSGARIRVDTPAGAGTLEDRADATFQAAPDQSLEHWVTEGRTGFANRSGRTTVRAGEQLAVAGSQAELDRLTDFNTFDQDGFDSWCNPLLNVPRSASAAKVPPEIRYYADDLDGRGDWVYVNECNAWCWSPTGVPDDWRPYWDGRWACYPGGMTWISAEPWGYVTSHFGRWGWGAGLGWYWIPGIYYSPAWVAWSTSDDYFGWAPLGFYNQPALWGYGPWRGGYAWNVVNTRFVGAGNIRTRSFASGPVFSALSRGAGPSGALFQGRMMVTPAEFRDPARVQQVAGQQGLLQQRTAAYAQAAQAATGRTLVAAQAGVRQGFESARPAAGQRPILREQAAPGAGTGLAQAPRTPTGERIRRDDRGGAPGKDPRTAPAIRTAPQGHSRPDAGGSGHAFQSGEARPGRGEGERQGWGSSPEESRPSGGMGHGGEPRPH